MTALPLEKARQIIDAAFAKGAELKLKPLGVSVLRAVKADLDPTGILNPGVLIP